MAANTSAGPEESSQPDLSIPGKSLMSLRAGKLTYRQSLSGKTSDN